MSSSQFGDGRQPPMDIPVTRSAPIDIPYPSSEARVWAQITRDRARNIGTFTDTSNEAENPGGIPSAEEFFLQYHYGTRPVPSSLRAGGCSPPISIVPRRPRLAPRLELAGPVTKARSRSRAATSFAGYEGQTIICAVAEGRGSNPPVGIAVVEPELGRVTTHQFSDTLRYVQTIHKIRMREPSHILVIPSTASIEKSALCDLLEKEIDGASVEPVPRSVFSERIGLEYIQEKAFRDDIEALKVVAAGNYYAVCSLAAAIQYVEDESRSKIAPHTLAIGHEPADSSMMIDVPSIHSLELLQNAQNPRSKNSLFGLLNHTLTPMGARQLRSSILQPSTKQDLILRRQAAVKELSDFQDLFYGVRNALKQLPDIDKVVSQLIFTSSKTDDGFAMNYENKSMINCILQIKQFVSAVPALYEALTSAKCDILVETRKHCRPEITQKVLGIINSHIDKDVQLSRTPLERRTQAIYAIKVGSMRRLSSMLPLVFMSGREANQGQPPKARNNSSLDVAREKYKEQQDSVHKRVGEFNSKQLSPSVDLPFYVLPRSGSDISRRLAKHNLSSEIKFDTTRGYYLRLPASDYMEVTAAHPGLLINAVHKRSHWEFQTIWLERINRDIKAAEDVVLKRSAQAIRTAADQLREEVPALSRLCEAVGRLDMLASLAHVVTTNDYCQPDISTSGAFKKARHPLVEKAGLVCFVTPDAAVQSHFVDMTANLHLLSRYQCIDNFVPNDYYSSEEYSFLLVTGVNMSGKTTFIKTPAMIQIMAQIGSFVPAQTASVPIIKKIFTRMIKDDCIEENVSAFSQEMREMDFILRNADAKSLVIIDELGRATSTRDGLAMAIAMAEQLLAIGARVVFATHFYELGQDLATRRASTMQPIRALVLNLKETLQQLGADDSSCALLGRVQDEFAEKLEAIGGGGGDDGDDDDEEEEEERQQQRQEEEEDEDEDEEDDDDDEEDDGDDDDDWVDLGKSPM
ncbi:MutS protein [Magnaporthiopsis poae ATCC 64411]|uniref:MutS protein n=1 Tax=Magnaporthiopsis poae (strain ATCC 64411 / 73-15) TaxID=644358 RepID=A0A0C4DU51_MAGP6|nr:MutS protein [Magnaporthiopsis poae ATCC 64411]